jgi:hypothetical protein
VSLFQGVNALTKVVWDQTRYPDFTRCPHFAWLHFIGFTLLECNICILTEGVIGSSLQHIPSYSFLENKNNKGKPFTCSNTQYVLTYTSTCMYHTQKKMSFTNIARKKKRPQTNIKTCLALINKSRTWSLRATIRKTSFTESVFNCQTDAKRFILFHFLHLQSDDKCSWKIRWHNKFDFKIRRPNTFYFKLAC